MAASKWEKLIAHSHWVTLRIGGRSLKVCARCTGCVVGFSLLLLLTLLVSFKAFTALPVHWQLLICVLFATPAILDWLTQSYGLRSSSNRLRIATGFLEGVGVALLSLMVTPLVLKVVILACIGGGALCLGLLLSARTSKRCLKVSALRGYP